MKKLIPLFLILFSMNSFAQIGIGTETPNASAILDVSSTTRGLLLPRMTTIQRDAIATPSAGLVIFNTTSNCLNMFTGAIWNELCGTATQGLIATIDCAGATHNGTLTSGSAASSVSSVISYTGGNGLPYTGQTVTSTGVTGLTATLSAGTMASGAGSLTYTITGTPSGSGNASFAISVGGQSCTLTRTVFAVGTIASAFNCGSATNNGTLTSGSAASSVSSVISYTNGNGGTHNGQTVTSTGVTGLTATLASGIFANGSGTLTYNITGTPSADGTATFAISIGGQTCALSRTVAAAATNVTCLQTATTIVDVLNPSTNKTWMDRNLGALRAATSFNDSFAYGDYYQWGRPADGHQCRTSNTTTTQSSTNQPSHGDFILMGMSNWRSNTSTVLWDGVNGVNNPCPSGYRIPTQAEYQAEVSSWGAQQNRTGAFASPLKFTTAGGRNQSSPGQIFQAGVNGFYWQSTTTSGLPISTNIRDTSVQTSGTQTTPSVGYSVRCIKN